MATKGNCPFLTTWPVYASKRYIVKIGDPVEILSESFKKDSVDVRGAVFVPNRSDTDAGLTYIKASSVTQTLSTQAVKVKFYNTSRFVNITIYKGSVIGSLVWGLRSRCYEDQYLLPLPDEKVAEQVVHLDRHHNDWRTRPTNCEDAHDQSVRTDPIVDIGRGMNEMLLADHHVAVRKYQQGIEHMHSKVAKFRLEGKTQAFIDGYIEETQDALISQYLY